MHTRTHYHTHTHVVHIAYTQPHEHRHTHTQVHPHTQHTYMYTHTHEHAPTHIYIPVYTHTHTVNTTHTQTHAHTFSVYHSSPAFRFWLSVVCLLMSNLSSSVMSTIPWLISRFHVTVGGGWPATVTYTVNGMTHTHTQWHTLTNMLVSHMHDTHTHTQTG